MLLGFGVLFFFPHCNISSLRARICFYLTQCIEKCHTHQKYVRLMNKTGVIQKQPIPPPPTLTGQSWFLLFCKPGTHELVSVRELGYFSVSENQFLKHLLLHFTLLNLVCLNILAYGTFNLSTPLLNVIFIVSLIFHFVCKQQKTFQNVTCSVLL